MIDDAIIKVAKELDELKEERVEYTVNNIAYKYEIECLKKEKKQLQNNWNELKKWIDSICFYDNDTITYEQISDRMQELEGNNENTKN